MFNTHSQTCFDGRIYGTFGVEYGWHVLTHTHTAHEKQWSTSGISDVEDFLWPDGDLGRFIVFYGITYNSIRFLHLEIALGWGSGAGWPWATMACTTHVL